jgi:hypothetical protein
VPVALKIGNVKSHAALWACPDGSVIRDQASPYDPAKFWTAADEDEFYHWLPGKEPSPQEGLHGTVK